jgi:hypothetical protein
VDICYHFICQVVKDRKVALYYIEGDKPHRHVHKESRTPQVSTL